MTSAFVLALALGVAATPSLAAEKPAKLEPIPGSDLNRVVLTPKAANGLPSRLLP
jgi:hypothetical protein